mgnify:CR=1 FL=1
MKTAIIALALISSSAFAALPLKGESCQAARAAVQRNGFQVIDGTVYYPKASEVQCAANEIVQQGWVGSCPVGYICVDKTTLYGLTGN